MAEGFIWILVLPLLLSVIVLWLSSLLDDWVRRQQNRRSLEKRSLVHPNNDMDRFSFNSKNENDTERLGRALAAALPPGTVVALIGTLGAGKTRLVQAVAEGMGAPAGEATSPTFVLVNEYRGRLPMFHIDAYRLRDDDEFRELGPEEYFESDGVTFIEWADRVEACLPTERLEIRCEATGETERRFTLSATSPTLADAIFKVRLEMEKPAEK